MKTETKNNGLFDYTSIQAGENRLLIEIGNCAEIGNGVALGYDYYDRKTRELLPERRKLETANVLEVWNYLELDNNQVLNAGEMILKDGEIYKVKLTHFLYQVLNNFDTFYQHVANLGDVLGGDVPEWIQPTGAHDAYKIGAKVKYNGKIYVSTVDNNVWAPGVYGWNLVND